MSVFVNRYGDGRVSLVGGKPGWGWQGKPGWGKTGWGWQGKPGWADAAGKVYQGWWPTAVVQVLGESVVVILFFRYRLANRSQCQLTTAPLEYVGDV